MKRDYCTQNDGDCETCSLSNYERNCMNNPIDDERHDETEMEHGRCDTCDT